MNNDKAAINAIFGDAKTFQKMINMALESVDLSSDENFASVFQTFVEVLDACAAVEVSEKVLGSDRRHLWIRTLGDVSVISTQLTMDECQFYDLDKCVNRLLSEIDSGDYIKAQESYLDIYAKVKIDQPDLSENDFKYYLLQVSKAVESTNKLVNAFNLAKAAERQAWNKNLEENLAKKGPALKRTKI